MKFDARIARDMASCYNEIVENSDLIIPFLYSRAREGKYYYSTSSDPLGEFRFKDIVKFQDKYKKLGFEVEIDEDMKAAWIEW